MIREYVGATAICDKCGHKEEAEPDFGGWDIPPGWVYFNRMDLCNNCIKESTVSHARQYGKRFMLRKQIPYCGLKGAQ